MNAYDDLWKCIESINNSSVKVDNIFVIDNGRGLKHNGQENLKIWDVDYNLGVAASWNKFIKEVPEIRIICNDDVIFSHEAIESIVNCYDPNNIIYPRLPQNNAFSCFMLPQTIVDRVGLFDELISPRYAYFEDNDYTYRMWLQGFGLKRCEVFVDHIGSSTLKHFTRKQEQEHHDRFRAARDRYIAKWGGEPEQERFKTPYGK